MEEGGEERRHRGEDVAMSWEHLTIDLGRGGGGEGRGEGRGREQEA